MGGFFLTNDTTALEKAVSIFTKKGLNNHALVQMGPDNRCLYFGKWNARNQPINDQYFSHNEDVIIGIGTFVYRDAIGTRALKFIYEDWSQFPHILSNIKGHFNLVTYVNGKLTVITDKASMYHSYYAFHGDMLYISSSFLSVAESIPHLTLSRQEGLEFICTSNWYGNSTVFQEIRPLPGGMLVNVERGLKMTPYFTLLFEGKPLTVDQSYRFIGEQLSWLLKNPPRISVDLTGGHDTRLIVAALKSLSVNFRCYINTEPGKPDVAIARRIAERENMILDVYNDIPPVSKEETEEYKDRVRKMFFLFDGCRSAFAAAAELNIHKYLAERADIRISGHGTELTRNYDWQKGYTGLSWNNFFDNIFTVPVLPDMREYKENLLAKITAVTPIGDKLTFLDINKIYYLTRCMYWAGTRITMANQYYYLYLPFEDISLVQFLFAMPAKEILNDSYHRRLIAKFDNRFNSYRYDRANPKSLAYRILISLLSENMKNIIRKMLYTVSRPRQEPATKNQSHSTLPFYLQKDFVSSVIGEGPLIVTNYFGIVADTQPPNVQDNIYSLELLLRHVGPKLRSC
jgi:hypothetical protein